VDVQDYVMRGRAAWAKPIYEETCNEAVSLFERALI
jgi:hypothetical protein